MFHNIDDSIQFPETLSSTIPFNIFRMYNINSKAEFEMAVIETVLVTEIFYHNQRLYENCSLKRNINVKYYGINSNKMVND